MSDVIELLTSDKQLALSWLRLQKHLQTILSDVGLDNILYVDGEKGNDLSALPGSLTHPYQTIQAALDAAENQRNVVFVAPGVYAENLVVPPALSNLTLLGSGMRETIVQSAVAGSPCLSWTAPAAGTVGQGLYIKDIGFQKVDNNNIYCILIDGVLRESAFQIAPLVLEDVGFNRTVQDYALHCIRLNNVVLRNIRILGGTPDIAFEEVSQFFGVEVECATFTIDYNAASPAPDEGRRANALWGSLLDALVVLNLGNVFVGNDVQCTTVTTNTVTATIGVDVVWGGVSFQGRCTDVVVEHTHTAVGGAAGGETVSRFDKAYISGDFSAADAGTSDERFFVTANNAVFTSADADSITAGAFCDLDIRGAFYPNQECLDVAGGGTIDRSLWVQVDDISGLVAGAVVFHKGDLTAIPYPANITGQGAYGVCMEFDTLADAPGTATAQLPAQYTATTTAANGNLVSTIIRQGG